MSSSAPLLKVRADRFEIRQGASYVSIDRARVVGALLRAGELTVRFKEGSDLVFECAEADPAEVKGLIAALQSQRDRNLEYDRRAKAARSSASVFPGILG